MFYKNNIYYLNRMKELYCKINFREKLFLSSATLFGGYSVNIVFQHFSRELFCIVGMMLGLVGSVGTASWIVAYCIYGDNNELDEDDEEETEYNKYISFINKDYETFVQMYKDNCEASYSISTKEDISKMKQKENHYTVELPFSYNSEMKFFYDDIQEYFYYYSQSDVNSKILNSVCRSYTLTNKCVQLFQDDEEICYMKNKINNNMEEKIKENETEENETGENETGENETEENETEENETEEKEGFINIFYSKNNRKKSNLKNELDQRTNKFLYKGTLIDYKNEYNSQKIKKKTSYKNYLKSI